MNSLADIKQILAGNGLDNKYQNWGQRLNKISADDVQKALSTPAGTYSLDKLTALVSPVAENFIEQMAIAANELTLKRFGRTIRLYAPVYLSNYCINSCRYCGFSKEHKFESKRLTVAQAVEEADIISKEGFRDILLVSGEDREYINTDYLAELAQRLRNKFSSIAIEIYQLNKDEYAKLFKAGIEGVTIYQETYNRDTYSFYHPKGPKADYDRRLRAPDDIASAGMREVGLGALLGLAEWPVETLALAEHAHYLMKKYWKSHVSISFPRIRPACGVETQQFEHLITDKNLVQMMLALRLCFADIGLVLSTREPEVLRDNLVKLGITKMSAGSKTSPGGYSKSNKSLEQFTVSDNRSASEVAEMLRAQGLEPVWKDWDAAFIK